MTTLLTVNFGDKIERLHFCRFTLFESHLTFKERLFSRTKEYTCILGFRFKTTIQYILQF
jgi:hypothetical protein